MCSSVFIGLAAASVKKIQVYFIVNIMSVQSSAASCIIRLAALSRSCKGDA